VVVLDAEALHGGFEEMPDVHVGLSGRLDRVPLRVKNARAGVRPDRVAHPAAVASRPHIVFSETPASAEMAFMLVPA